MAFVLVRIDDRLIHGQVTVAWGTWLSPDRIILVNDEVATTDWRRDLYAGTDAMGAAVSILSIADFIEKVRRGVWDGERAIVIVESPRDLLALLKAGVTIPEVNVGGMHYSEGKRELLPYVYVDEEDVAAMREILKAGTRLVARDVPQATPVDLAGLIASGGRAAGARGDTD